MQHSSRERTPYFIHYKLIYAGGRGEEGKEKEKRGFDGFLFFSSFEGVLIWR